MQMNANLFPLNIHCGCFLNKPEQNVVSLSFVVCGVTVVPGRAFPLLCSRQSGTALLHRCLHPTGWHCAPSLLLTPFFPGTQLDKTVCWREKQFQVLFPARFLTLSHAVPQGANVQQARRAQVSSRSIWVSCREGKTNIEEVTPGTPRDTLGQSLGTYSRPSSPA